MENLEIGTWLLQQAPVVVVMGIVIWWLAKRLEKAQDEKDVLSRDVVKISVLWQEQSDNGKDEEIIKLLTEIKTIVSNK
ncbi:MAG: hypothetical protein DI539_16090 [Flavobacterium psychrophilum]|nr:MAG: hypothetical protein DI539_16090 [Flavobacterium psychrophilum]